MFKRYFLMDAASDTGGAGGGAGADPAAAANAGDAAATLLAQQKADAAAAAAAADKAKADPLAAYPERFRVFKDDKTLDLEKTAAKGFESYAQLEKRMKDVGLPPDTADGYEFKAPDGVPFDEKLTKEFKAKALEAGLTKKQFEFAMNAYVDTLINLPAQMEALRASHASQMLPIMLKAFKGDRGEYEKNKEYAEKAFESLFGNEIPEIKANANELKNSPAFIRALGEFGREMQEDRTFSLYQKLSTDEWYSEQMNNPNSAYRNAADPQHKSAVEKMSRHFEAQHKLKERTT